jgi:hypothetical protein
MMNDFQKVLAAFEPRPKPETFTAKLQPYNRLIETHRLRLGWKRDCRV